MSLSSVNNIILEVNNLVKYFPIYGGILYRRIGQVHALNGVSFKIKRGETLGIVGESGCGKTTLGRTLLRLYEASGGNASFEGCDLFLMNRKVLARNIQMIFQDPFSSLNPRMTVEEIITEPFVVHKLYSKEERSKKIYDILDYIGMRRDALSRYPHEFSGGQRQRIGVARALALNPKIIVADEPVSALDVSIQSQILNLMCDLQKELGITYLFISHDLSVVEYISDSIAVMYLGYIVEKAAKVELFKNPLHPYTKSLLSAIPVPDPKVRGERVILKGDIPSPVDLPPGCPFASRCSVASEECSRAVPKLKNVSHAKEEHLVACIKVKS